MASREEIIGRTLRPFERGVWDDGEAFQKISADDRRRWARGGQALPDGSFPIVKCKGEGPSAENAVRARGRGGPPPARRAQIERHIRKRVRALGCSGPPFDDFMGE